VKINVWRSALRGATSDTPRFLRVLQILAGNDYVAAHIVTAPDRCRDFPLIPISDYHAIINVDPTVKYISRWRNGPLQRDKLSPNLTGYAVVYREVDQEKYAEYSSYGGGAEEKELFAYRVEKHTVHSVQELVDILATYNVKLDDMRLGRMED